LPIRGHDGFPSSRMSDERPSYQSRGQLKLGSVQRATDG
jgi:hypothetical protein